MRIGTDLVEALLADEADPTHLVAGLECASAQGGIQSNGGFRTSSDGGATFGGVTAGPCVRQLVQNGSAIYAAGRDYSAVSMDRGATWTRLSTDALSVEVTSVAAADEGKTVYLGTIGGLYKSTTGGL